MLKNLEQYINLIRQENKISKIIEAFDKTLKPSFDFDMIFSQMRSYSDKINPIKVNIENVDDVNEKIKDLGAISSSLNHLYIELSTLLPKFKKMYSTGIAYLRNIPEIKSIGKEPEILVFNDMYEWNLNIDAVYDIISKLTKEIGNVINNIEMQQKNCQMDRWIGTTPNRTNKRDSHIAENNKKDAALSLGSWK